MVSEFRLRGNEESEWVRLIAMRIERRPLSFRRKPESIFAARTLDSGPVTRTGQALRWNDNQEAGRALFIPLCGFTQGHGDSRERSPRAGEQNPSSSRAPWIPRFPNRAFAGI